MNSIIICEGNSDYALLQYYMQAAYDWKDKSAGAYKYKKQKSRLLENGDNQLIIAPSGGCSEIPSELEDVIERNKNATNTEIFNKIVILTDNDDELEKDKITEKISCILKKNGKTDFNLKNNEWIDFSIVRKIQPNRLTCSLLTLIIPFDENGALETFLLKALASKNEYDKILINKSKEFVDQIANIQLPEKEENYLNHRRYKTKAEFDVYFSVRTPAEQFVKRRDLIKSVRWEEYSLVKKCFSELGKL